ncbi:UdgX family uracil-DNA binding protein [Sphingobium nicotianae]|uniref:Type-4 uracil-DNA glycosylase n=1 Tax=Sphingobium nicotianae TaxID=2782607 RepID=A0A9X1AJ82_9SPHN|nr:UdgX family uracil-DNA binding protein [Sphingobium nicotianae]MBT2185454.1 UdgX family uracil-DNA binding protein [Sphingobium nicotianae]
MRETVFFTTSDHVVALDAPDDFEAWRGHARALLVAGIEPDRLVWLEPGAAEADLFRSPGTSPVSRSKRGFAQPKAPRDFLDLASQAILHRDPGRFDLLYGLLWRLQGNGRLLEDKADPQVRRVDDLTRAVRRDMHKMRAFLRFREVRGDDGDSHYVAWFEPDHHILRASAAFFVDRFADMHWSILTPDGSLHWDKEMLREGPPAQRSDAPPGDPIEELWRSYYASIFNPARLKVGAMLKEMPRKYWKNMPETALIPALVAGAQAREATMVEAGRDLFEEADAPDSLDAIAQAIQHCRRCPIGCNGTRAVAGEGPKKARLMIVGEQPGDVEEEQGRPFVGPAGQLLMAHLEAAGIDRKVTYVTNAVKHFKYLSRGKRRLHQTPTAKEIDICRWWIDNERRIVKPRLILALGASAARGLLHKTIRIQQERGRPMMLEDGGELWVTAHPSYLLRLRDEGRATEEKRFRDDLKAVAKRLTSLA